MAKTIARMLTKGSLDAGCPCAVRLAVVANTYDIKRAFGDALDDGIEVREIHWKSVSRAEVANANRFQRRNVDLLWDHYMMPDDGINNCADSDAWFVVSDRFSQPLAPVRPYVVFATDYIQRYVPSILNPPVPGEADLSYLRTVRQANAVFVTTPQTGADAISYAGVPARKVFLAPMDFDCTTLTVDRIETATRSDFFVWPTNTAVHKNHLRSFEALSIYYEEFEGQLKVRLTGPNTTWFNPRLDNGSEHGNDAYVARVRAVIQRSKTLMKMVQFSGELSDRLFARGLADAKFVWHPTLIDNGTFVIAEAAYMGCPALANDYPQLRYISDRFDLPTVYFDAKAPREMALALKNMEVQATTIKTRLPSQKELEAHSWRSYAGEYWTLFLDAIA